MIKETGSATAVGAATLRAAHQLIDGDEKLLNDPVILKLLGTELQEHILQNRSRFFEPGTMAMRTHIVLRSKYAEDCLKQAYDNGVRQFVILGAGLDTFAYRQPAWAHDLKIIEADHAASQADKLQRLKQAGIPIPSNLTFVKVDLETDNLSAILGESAIDTNEPVFMACLGVLIYLNKKAVDNIFRFAGSLHAKSEFVFTVSQKSEDNDLSLTAERAAMAGEPWITYFSQPDLIKQLNDDGFNQVSFLTPDEAIQLYFSNIKLQIPPPRRTSIVRTTI
jgi:methyltransferase (TIGR00027 family)